MGQLEDRHVRIEKRNADIKDMYVKLSEKKVNNKRYILKSISFLLLKKSFICPKEVLKT